MDKSIDKPIHFLTCRFSHQSIHVIIKYHKHPQTLKVPMRLTHLPSFILCLNGCVRRCCSTRPRCGRRSDLVWSWPSRARRRLRNSGDPPVGEKDVKMMGNPDPTNYIGIRNHVYYIYIYTCLHTHTHAYIYIVHIFTYTHTYTHTFIYIYTLQNCRSWRTVQLCNVRAGNGSAVRNKVYGALCSALAWFHSNYGAMRGTTWLWHVLDVENPIQ